MNLYTQLEVTHVRSEIDRETLEFERHFRIWQKGMTEYFLKEKKMHFFDSTP